VHLDLPIISPHQEGEFTQNTPSAVEWNISKVGAPQVWEAGYTGNGVVIGGQDTGYDWEHPALKSQYRGWNGTSANHNYNWLDAIHSGNEICESDSLEPCDDHGHGTHTMGTMVGDDGTGEQIGMAPGARWIGCRNMDQGVGTPATYSECFEWFIAPTKLNGENPNPELAPDVINNSWYCPPDEGCNWDSLLPVVNNTRAAGIVVVVSAGNSGVNGCGSVDNPPAIYDSSFTVGATDSSDNITSLSSRGPADHTNLLKPDISAPGQGIRSSLRGGGYGSKSGTSMAAPHVSGLVALLLSARPYLTGQVEAIETQIKQNALPLTTLENCGGVPGNQIPNNTYGWGRVNAPDTIFYFTYYPLVMKTP
jgi:subtilisin family serine protease